jgi:hypothetical protein
LVEMLRLVTARAKPMLPHVQRVAILQVEQDLANYIERPLRLCWPNVVVQHLEDWALLSLRPTDLCISGVEPPASLSMPTLWLGEVGRSAGHYRIGEQLWKISTPISSRGLLRAVTEMLG